MWGESFQFLTSQMQKFPFQVLPIPISLNLNAAIQKGHTRPFLATRKQCIERPIPRSFLFRHALVSYSALKAEDTCTFEEGEPNVTSNWLRTCFENGGLLRSLILVSKLQNIPSKTSHFHFCWHIFARISCFTSLSNIQEKSEKPHYEEERT